MAPHRPKKASAAPLAPLTRRVAPQPYLRIGFLVHDVSRMRRTLFDQAIKPLGITRAQWWALANLSRHDTEGVIQSDLARLMDVGKVTIGGLIDRLEASGHVERRSDKADRRIKRVYITKRGYEVIELMTTVARDLNATILKDIPLDQVHLAEEVMAQMKSNLRELLGAEAKAEPQDGAEGAGEDAAEEAAEDTRAPLRRSA